MTLCICGCGQRAVHLHHVVYQQHIPLAQRDAAANLVPIAFHCHGAHHGRSRPLCLHLLPDEAYSFAAKVLGRGKAYEYLNRRYAGSDIRLERLLEDVAA